MTTATCEIEVHAQPALIWSVLWDVERYPEFISDCVDTMVEPLEADQGTPQQRIQMSVQLIRPLSYAAVMHGQPPTLIKWQADMTGGYLKSHHGQWRIEPAADGRTCILYYELTVSFDMHIADAVLRRFAELNLPTMLRQVKARAESLARRHDT